MSVQRRKYELDFKRNAIRLTEEPGLTIVEAADNLGICTKTLSMDGGVNYD